MKEFFDILADFVKKMMQPLITFTALLVFMTYAGQKLFTSDQVYWVVGGVILFWFGYTAIKNFNFNGKDESPKAEGSSGLVGSRVNPGWGNCEGCEDENPWGYTESSKTASTAENWASVTGKGTDDTLTPFQKHFKAVQDDLEDDGIDLTDEAYASRMLPYLGNHEDDMDDATKEQWVRVGLQRAINAFEAKSGMDAPDSYDDVADHQKWWRSNKKTCAVKDWGIIKPLLMNLRAWLKLSDLGEW
jgi:hypothetical protein